jgi:hypothetical protein
LGTGRRAELTERIGPSDGVPVELGDGVATQRLDGREDPIQDRAFAFRLVVHASQSKGDQTNEARPARETL